jgi:hypothetical protein
MSSSMIQQKRMGNTRPHFSDAINNAIDMRTTVL